MDKQQSNRSLLGKSGDNENNLNAKDFKVV
jgi:hypothetical protein